MAVRVAGTDPGTSSLDALILEDGAVSEQRRFTPNELRADAAAPVRWLEALGPFDLVAAPSGYGLPLVRGGDCTERDLALMALARPDDRRHQGVAGFSAVARAFRDSPLPVVFLPGVIHLPTVPPHRKLNRIDLGTPDKLCVAALAAGAGDAVVVELGAAFTARIALRDGQVVAGLGGTSGPLGWASGGAWDGEFAYLLSPLGKADLFAGGAAAAGEWGRAALVESVCASVVGLTTPLGLGRVFLSGRLVEREPDLGKRLTGELARLGLAVDPLAGLPGAWVKHAAQGAAVIADGMAGGRHQAMVDRLRLREASGTVLDWLRHPRADEVRAMFA